MGDSEDVGTPREDDQSDSGAGQRSEGQVSEVAAMPPESAGEPITPGDATAGYPFEDAESGRPDEGTAGPDAPPRHGRPEPSNESSR